MTEEGPGNLDAWNRREERAGNRLGEIGNVGPEPVSFKLTAHAFCPVYASGAPAPVRKAGLAHLGFRRSHQ